MGTTTSKLYHILTLYRPKGGREGEEGGKKRKGQKAYKRSLRPKKATDDEGVSKLL